MLSKYSLPRCVFRDGNTGASLSPDFINRQFQASRPPIPIAKSIVSFPAQTVCVPGLDGGTVSHDAQNPLLPTDLLDPRVGADGKNSLYLGKMGCPTEHKKHYRTLGNGSEQRPSGTNSSQ